ncbi:demethylmenaquinone methyltransferase/2-methoxy-6-polyprenyl-1,4-benzoquinol methylase [Hamadaea flava]|uniref:Class I SAM-dependent methyltransferase n=1 Tax=Hamadaea flava TaxID=1742688 RepID=A0ABV8LMS5_9ACTN|nr:class I SAM-dependent methyltransferase [Hamadaea flava]MCP2324030.1 demethylmenaquinone methyltransferase/2-methoxy-6-polyprenyl-1,4-benzoquinol methylase [Hamadaea flava]
MTDDVVAEQVDYYRRRAAEYDATAYGDLAVARPRIARLVEQMRPAGRVLEIACGTGVWTEPLAAYADSLTAVDFAPEALAIARERVTSPNVTFVVADVFDWTSDAQFDVIFFSAWLSHVPPERFGAFWDSLRPMLADGGRVLFLDEHVDERGKESYLREGVVERRLSDGSTFRVVKHFVEPDAMTARLRELGWECDIQRDGDDWVLGEARPRF